MHVTFDLSENRKDDALRTKQQESNLKQGWGQAFVALVAFAICIQLFWSVQSNSVHSPVQSRVQVLQRPSSFRPK